MSYIKMIKEYTKQNGGIITSAYCLSNNIPTIYLNRLTKAGYLNKITRGLYLSEEGDYDVFYIFQYQFKKTVYSYETALYLLGITDKIIQNMDVTVSRNYKFNKNNHSINIYPVKKELFDLGVIDVKTNYGNIVKVYSYERTICDFISKKDEVDIEVYLKMLHSYSKYPKKDLNQLYDIALKMNLLKEVREIMELIYE